MHRFFLFLACLLIPFGVVQAEQFLYYPFASSYDPPSQYINSYGCPNKCHTGTDYGCAYNTPIYAAISGTVTQLVDDQPDGVEAPGCDEDADYGNYITIESGNRRVRYAHCKKYGFVISQNDAVIAGQLIGYTSNSGYTCGSGPHDSYYHLHFEIWLYESGQWNYKDPYNDGLWLSPRVYGGSPTYNVVWQEQFPTYSQGENALYLIPNETISCGLKVLNNSNVPLSNKKSSEWYIELHSTNSSYNQDATCALDASNWLTSTHIVSSNTDCQPSQSTWYYFNITTPSAPGTYWLYMMLYRPHGGYGWVSPTGWNVKVVVVDPDPDPGCTEYLPFVGNFNSDNYCDLLAHCSSARETWVATNTQSGALSSSGIWIEAFGGTSCDNLVGDFNHDGYDEFLAHDPSDRKTWVVINTQQGSFTKYSPGGLWLEEFGSTSCDNLSGDFNHDGYDEFLAHDPNQRKTWVVINTQQGSFTKNTSGAGLWLEAFGDPDCLNYVADVNHDGYPDLIAHDPVERKTWVAINTQQNSFTKNTMGAGLWLEAFGDADCVNFFKDVNHDGYPDFIAHDTVERKTWVAINTQQGGFTKNTMGAGLWLSSWGNSDHIQRCADFNADGYNDLLSYDPSGGVAWVALNQQDNSFESDGSWISSWPSGGAAKIALDDIPQVLPISFLLSQNYPNPFNPATTISYSLPEATHVTLDVFNILGQKVVNLVNTDQPAGEYQASWDASKFSSGVYFYRLQTEAAVETKKMLLLK